MKKLLSLALVAALVIAMIPAAFASEVSPCDHEFIFNQASHGIEQSSTYSFSTGTITPESTVSGNKWGYASHKTGTNYGLAEDRINWSIKSEGKLPIFPMGADGDLVGHKSLMALDLVIEKAGTYTPEFVFRTSPDSPIVELFLVPQSAINEADLWKWYMGMKNPADANQKGTADTVFNSISSPSMLNYRIGIVDMYGATVTANTKRPLKNVTLEKGKYMFVIVLNGTNANFAETLASDGSYRTNLNPQKLLLKEVMPTPADNFDYATTFDVYKKDDMYTKNDSSQSLDGLREDGSNYILMNPNLMGCSAESSMNSSGNATTPYKVIDSTLTDTWDLVAYFSESGSVRIQSASNSLFFNARTGTTSSGAATQEGKDWHYQYRFANAFLLFKVNISTVGQYTLSIGRPFGADAGMVPAVYFIKPTENDSINSYFGSTNCTYTTSYDSAATKAFNTFFDAVPSNKIGYMNFSKLESIEGCNPVGEDGYAEIGVVRVTEPGDYYIALSPDDTCRTKNPTVIRPASGNMTQQFNMSGMKLEPYTDTQATVDSANKNEIINEDGGTKTPVASGVTTTANVSALAAYINGDEVSGGVIDTESAAFGKKISFTAPDAPEGYEFLYWAKAGTVNKSILSFDEKLDYIPVHGANRIIAVYKKIGGTANAKAEFYNANKQLLSSSTSATVTIPELPAMAGYGEAIGWALYGTDAIYQPDDTVELSGEMLFVAQYNDLTEGAISVTVQNGSGSGNYTYGDVVTCTATMREGGSGANAFNYWEKDGEIVSFSTTYTFNAWEDCTVKAVYKEYRPSASELRKIILSTMDDGNIMAEFIGVADAVEKGILFGADLANATRKVVMTGTGTQFTVEDNVDGDPKGYALFADGSVVYSD